MLVLLATSIGDVLMVETLAQTIGEIAIVALEGVGERISLSLEGDALVVVVVEGLVDSSRGTVGWYPH